MTKKKKVKTSDGALYSPWQLLYAANAYYALSQVLTSQIPSDAKLANPFTHDPSSVAASATNRILALELYLKSVLVGNNSPVPWDHDLKVLYDALPEEIREIIEPRFNELTRPEEIGNAVTTLFHCFQIGRSLPTEWQENALQSMPQDFSLTGLLSRNRDGFALTRYLFEKARADRETVFSYEHLRLGVLCRVLCEVLESSLQNRLPDYKRGFEF